MFSRLFRNRGAVRREFVGVTAVLSIVMAVHVDAQNTVAPPRDVGPSVVMQCRDCGTIESIREVQEPRAATPPGTASASPVGLVMYIPLGRKPANDSPYIGSVGTRQWQDRTGSTRYEFTVRMDDGTYQFLSRQGVSDFAAGDRVKVSQLQIEHWTQ
jgi:hypothetical protein